MKVYNKYIAESYTDVPHLFAFTAVVNNKNNNSQSTFTKFKSLVQTNLKNGTQLDSSTIDLILKSFSRYFNVENFDATSRNVIIYATIDIAKQEVDEEVIFSKAHLENTFEIGDHFNLVPLKVHLNLIKPRLGVVVTKDHVIYFRYENYTIEQLEKIKNIYYEEYRTDLDMAGFEGGGGENLRPVGINSSGERNDKQLNIFKAQVNDLKRDIDKYLDEFDSVFVYYSSNYSSFIEEELRAFFSGKIMRCNFVLFNVSIAVESGQFLQRFVEDLEEYLKEMLEKELENGRQNGILEYDIERVVEAVNNSQIKKLYISYFMNGNGERELDRAQLNSMVQAVHQYGGEIEAVPANLLNSEVAATLRFKL